jgi:hypothetical protein
MDFRKNYTKYIKEVGVGKSFSSNSYNFTVAGDIDRENPVNPDNAKEIEDILLKKGIRADVSPSETKYNEVVVKTTFSKSHIERILDRAGILESLEEKIKPYMISYSDKYGNHVGFSDGDTLRDIQNKAQKLRKKGFKIDKMGKYNPPVDKKYLYKPEIEGVFEGFVPFVPAHMRYMNKKKAQDAIDKVTDRAGNIRFVKHFENDTVGLVRFIYGEKELKNFDFQFPGIYYKNKRVTFHDLILKAREKVDGAKKILGLGKYKKEEKELKEKYFSFSNIAKAVAIAKKSSGNYTGAAKKIDIIAMGLSDYPKVRDELLKANEEKQMKEAFPKPKEDKDKKIKDLENKVQKLEVEKESELNPEPNPDTGEIPLQVGIAYKYIRDKAKGIVDKEEKKKEKKEVKVGKKTLTNKRKEKIDVEPEMDVM